MTLVGYTLVATVTVAVTGLSPKVTVSRLKNLSTAGRLFNQLAVELTSQAPLSVPFQFRTAGVPPVIIKDTLVEVAANSAVGAPRTPAPTVPPHARLAVEPTRLLYPLSRMLVPFG